MPDEFGGCDAQTPMSDAEIAGIFREAADENGLVVGRVELLVIDGRCVMAGDHEEHADYVAIPDRGTDRIWLRWNSSGRRSLGLVGDCAAEDGCVQFAGHDGDCDFDPGEQGATA